MLAPIQRSRSGHRRSKGSPAWRSVSPRNGQPPPSFIYAASRLISSAQQQSSVSAISIAEAAVREAAKEIERRAAATIHVPPPSTRAMRLEEAVIEAVRSKIRSGHMLTQQEMRLLEKTDMRDSAEIPQGAVKPSDRQRGKELPSPRVPSPSGKPRTANAGAAHNKTAAAAKARIRAEKKEQEIRLREEAEEARRLIEVQLVAEATADDQVIEDARRAEERRRLREEAELFADETLVTLIAATIDEVARRKEEEARRKREAEERALREAEEAEKAKRDAAAAAVADALAAQQMEKIKAKAAAAREAAESSNATTPVDGRSPMSHRSRGSPSPLNSARSPLATARSSGSNATPRSMRDVTPRSGMSNSTPRGPAGTTPRSNLTPRASNRSSAPQPVRPPSPLRGTGGLAGK